MISLVLFGSLVVLLILNVPVSISLGIASLITILVSGDLTSGYIVQNLVTSADSFTTMSIPFFVLAGEIMGGGGISKRLMNTARAFFGRYTGGLAIVTVVVCMFFAAISGSGPATVAAVGGMVIPSMLEAGYDKKFTLAVIAAAGSIGVIIPPSIPMVIYSVSTGQSVSELFMAGFIPGILIGLTLILYCHFTKHGYKGDEEPFSWKNAGKVAWDAKWALICPVIILGGIYGGIFTPTEAAAVAAAYGFIIGVFVYKEIKLSDIFTVIRSGVLTTSTIMIVIGCAAVFTKVLAVEKIPTAVADLIVGLNADKIVILILINVVLLFVGCFMETLCAIMILAPIFLPIVTAVGVNPVHFGIIMVVNLAIGFITPPLGINLFVASRVGKAQLSEVIQGIVPFIVVMIVDLLLITYIPAISILLPSLFMG